MNLPGSLRLSAATLLASTATVAVTAYGTPTEVTFEFPETSVPGLTAGFCVVGADEHVAVISASASAFTSSSSSSSDSSSSSYTYSALPHGSFVDGFHLFQDDTVLKGVTDFNAPCKYGVYLRPNYDASMNGVNSKSKSNSNMNMNSPNKKSNHACSNYPRDADYRGTIHTTINGEECQSWDVQSSSSSSNEGTSSGSIISSNPHAGLESNYCRSPDYEDAAWCYTSADTSTARTDEDRTREYCDIPKCTPAGSSVAITATLVNANAETDGQPNNKNCAMICTVLAPDNDGGWESEYQLVDAGFDRYGNDGQLYMVNDMFNSDVLTLATYCKMVCSAPAPAPKSGSRTGVLLGALRASRLKVR